MNINGAKAEVAGLGAAWVMVQVLVLALQ